jgi:hypothetical protein
MFVRHDQNVSWRGGAQVAERGHLFVTKDICAGEFFRDDLTKNTACHIIP